MMFFLEYELYRIAALFMVAGLPAMGILAGGLLLGPLGSLLGVAGGVAIGIRAANAVFRLYCLRMRQCYLGGRTTAHLLEELRGPEPRVPWMLVDELRKRGHDLLPELHVVHRMLTSDKAETRSSGWEALQAGYPALAGDVAPCDPAKPESCAEAAQLVEEFLAAVQPPLPPTDSSSGTPS